MSTFRQRMRSKRSASGKGSAFRLSRWKRTRERISGPAFMFPACGPVPLSMKSLRYGGGISLALASAQTADRAFSKARVERSVAKMSNSHPEEDGNRAGKDMAREKGSSPGEQAALQTRTPRGIPPAAFRAAHSR